MPLRLEDLTPNAQVKGLIGREGVRIFIGQMTREACDLVFRDGHGNLQSQILFRNKEADLKLLPGGRKWNLAAGNTLVGKRCSPNTQRWTISALSQFSVVSGSFRAISVGKVWVTHERLAN